MLKIKKRKVRLLLLIICLFLGVFFITWFLSFKNISVKAQEQLRIFPISYSSEWQNPDTACLLDLNPEATLKDFNTNNSAYPLFVPQAQELQLATTTETTTSEIINNTTRTIEIIPTEATTTEVTSNETITPKATTTETTITEEHFNTSKNLSTSTEEITSPTEIATTSMNNIYLAKAKTKETSFFRRTWMKINKLLQELSIKLGYIFKREVMAEEATSTVDFLDNPSSPSEEIITSTEEVFATNSQEKVIEEIFPEEEIISVERTLELFNFPIINKFEEIEIKNIYLNISLAGKGEVGSELIINYYYQDSWHYLTTIDLNKEISNALNGGYFSYPMPAFNSPQELEDLIVRFTYSGFPALNYNSPSIYLDAAWLGINYGEEGIVKGVQEENFEAAAEFNLELISDQKDFKLAEQPIFKFRYKKKRGFIKNLGAKILGIFRDEYKDIKIKAVVTEIAISPDIRYEKNGEFFIDLPELPRQFKPGKHKLKVEIENQGQILIQEQDFTWGVLAINTNKSIYLPGEQAYLQMAALRDDGHTICDAVLELKIKAPDGVLHNLSTKDGTINYSGKCGRNNVTDVPDYFAYYQVGETGIYEMKLINLDNGYEIFDSFEVRNSVPFEIERIGPTRIYPPEPYDVTLEITANEDFTGVIEEKVPVRFHIYQPANSQKYSSISVGGNTKTIKWDVSLSTNEQIQLGYRFDAPDISPYLFLTGFLEIGSFQETRRWQIASDANSPGDYIIMSNTASTTSITSTAIDIGWDTEVVTNGSSISYSDTVFTLTSGKYLVLWSERVDGDSLNWTNNLRTEVQGRLVINGTATTTGAGQVYNRNGETSCGAPDDCVFPGVLSGAGILQIDSDDTTLTTQFYRTDSTGASINVNRVPGWGGIIILALDDTWDYARYSLSSNLATVDNFADIVWSRTDEEETGFSRSGADITISSDGKYLATYSIPIQTNSGSDRTEYVSRMRLNDSEIIGTRVSTYIRQSQSCQDGVLSYVGIITASSSDVLDVELDATDGTISSDYMLAGAVIQILKLPASAEIFIVEATATGDMDANSITEFAWETTPYLDSSFTDTSPTDAVVEPASAGDYLFFATQATDAGQTRRVSSGRFTIDDELVTYAAGGQYNRNSGANDAGFSFGALLPSLIGGEDISLVNLGLADLTGGQDCDYGAMSGLSLSSLGFVSGPNLSWDTGLADFEIYESASLTWDAGTLVCSGTLTDDNSSTIECSSGYIFASTQYRVQVVLQNYGGTIVNMRGASDYVDHKNIKSGWAGSNPSLGNCGFNDFDADNGATSCSIAYNGNDVRITNVGAGNVKITDITGSEGFMYLITTDSNATATSTSYMNTSIDTEPEDSSLIQIYTAPDLRQQHYRWRYDNGGEGDWYDPAWGYRKKITIAGSSGAGTDYQVKLIIGYSSDGDFDCEGNCQTDFDDIRFTDNDGYTLLDYWREDYVDSATSTFWIEVADNLDSNQDIYVYYNNGSANTTSDATSTFIFWDDFDGTSLDTSSRWDTSSGNPPTTWSVHDGYLSMWDEWGGYCSMSGVYNRLNTQQSFTPPIAVETRFSISGTDSIGATNICYHTILDNRDVVGISNSTYGYGFRINTASTYGTFTYPAKDTWYRISKYYETDQLRAITSYGIDNSYSGSVISSGVIGLAGDTDADLESYMTDRVDWIAIRKYIDPEPSFSAVDSEEAQAEGATFILAEDTGLEDLETASTTRLRFLISSEGGQATTTVYQLEYAKADTCSSGSYAVVTTDYSGDFNIATSTYITDGEPTINITGLTDPVSGNTFTAGELHDENSTTSPITLSTTQFTEIEYTLEAVDGNAEAGAQYCFRLTNSGDNTNFTYTTYATTTIESAGTYLYFSVDSSTVTFPNITPGTLVATTSVLEVRTNNSTGFYITLESDDRTLTDGVMDDDSDASNNLPDKTEWIAAVATTTAGNATASTTEPQTLQFRVQQAGTDEANYASSWWGTDDITANALFAGIASSTAATANKKIVIRSTPATATTTIYILYNLNVPATQKSGTYSGGLTFTAIVNP